MSDEKKLLPVHKKTHSHTHERLTTHIQAMVAGVRGRLGLESVWSIEVCVCCPEDLPSAEASIWWHAELFYARLYMRCSHRHTKNGRLQLLSEEIIDWLVYHELCELQTWRATNYVNDMIQDYVDAFPSGTPERGEALYHAARIREEWQVLHNQEIEARVAGLLGKRRPGYLERDPIAIHAGLVKQNQEDTRKILKGNE